mmetsp:Transcript_11182/g.19080  ORF Transcript_11182/g.19080 Transcript_11182/m.19080 type:complete len:208 (+) Transcript_11182:993-1616(+)
MRLQPRRHLLGRARVGSDHDGCQWRRHRRRRVRPQRRGRRRRHLELGRVAQVRLAAGVLAALLAAAALAAASRGLSGSGRGGFQFRTERELPQLIERAYAAPLPLRGRSLARRLLLSARPSLRRFGVSRAAVDGHGVHLPDLALGARLRDARAMPRTDDEHHAHQRYDAVTKMRRASQLARPGELPVVWTGGSGAREGHVAAQERVQ